MKRIITLLLLSLVFSLSWGQSIIGKWEGPSRTEKTVTFSSEVEFLKNGKSNIYVIFETHAQYDFTIKMRCIIKGEYESYGKALSQTFDSKIEFLSPSVEWGPNCPFDKNQRAQFEKELLPELKDSIIPEIQQYAKVLLTKGMYRQIVMLNEDELWISVNNSTEKYKRIRES